MWNVDPIWEPGHVWQDREANRETVRLGWEHVLRKGNPYRPFLPRPERPQNPAGIKGKGVPGDPTASKALGRLS